MRTRQASIPGLAALAGLFGPGALGGQAAWIAGPFAVQQVVRLATNIALARMLAPEMFGLMLLVNTLRTGAELLSDIGIGQSVVRSRHAHDPAFVNTAWTLQLVRGVLLSVLALIVAFPLGAVYHNPAVTPIIAVVSSVFVLTGLQSPALFLIQREIRLKRRAAYDMGSTVFQCALTLVLALVMPSVWALVWGLVISTAFSSAMSYFVAHVDRPRLAWHAGHAHEILHFGKWVFLATAIYFAATSTDKLYFTAILPLALAGVYSVARTFADMAGQLAQRVGAFLIFPKVAAMRGRRSEAAVHLRRKRFRILAAIGLAMALGIAGADRFILLCYDARYHVAAFLLPLLLAGTWFAVLATFAEATLLGCDRPAPAAWGNGAKFTALLIGLPLAIAHGSLTSALLVLIAAEAVRWLVLALVLQQERLATLGDDLVLTALAAGAAFGAKVLLAMAGLVPSLAQWWALGQAVHG